MINLLYILFILLSGSIFIALKFNQKIEKTIIINFMLIIFILYIFGLCGFLKAGVYFVQLLSISSIIYSVIYFIKNKETAFNNIITPGFIMFILMYFILIFIHKGRVLINWDEFSHWGDVVKAMFTINDFSTSPLSMSTFQSYPPAMSLFQYFFESINGKFIEYYLYLSYQIFGIALFLPFLEKLKKPLNILIAFIIIFLTPSIFFPNYYTSILIDPMVGLVFAYSVALIYKNENINNLYILNFALILFTLILLKDVGLFLAIISLIIFTFSIFLKDKNKKSAKKIIRKHLIYLGMLVLVVFLTKLSWWVNIKLNNAAVIFPNNINFKELLQIMIGKYNGYKNIVVSNFISNIFNESPVKYVWGGAFTNILANNDCIWTIILLGLL